MAKFSAACLTTAGSSTLPISSIYGTTTVRPRLAELSVFNTTATAVSLRLVRVTTAGTRGTTLTTMPDIFEEPASVATAYNTHTVAPTISTGDLYRFVLGAAVGSGFVMTWPDGLVIPATANAGLALVPVGTGQACEVTWRWLEG